MLNFTPFRTNDSNFDQLPLKKSKRAKDSSKLQIDPSSLSSLSSSSSSSSCSSSSSSSSSLFSSSTSLSFSSSSAMTSIRTKRTDRKKLKTGNREPSSHENFVSNTCSTMTDHEKLVSHAVSHFLPFLNLNELLKMECVNKNSNIQLDTFWKNLNKACYAFSWRTPKKGLGQNKWNCLLTTVITDVMFQMTKMPESSTEERQHIVHCLWDRYQHIFNHYPSLKLCVIAQFNRFTNYSLPPHGMKKEEINKETKVIYQQIGITKPTSRYPRVLTSPSDALLFTLLTTASTKPLKPNTLKKISKLVDQLINIGVTCAPLFLIDRRDVLPNEDCEAKAIASALKKDVRALRIQIENYTSEQLRKIEMDHFNKNFLAQRLNNIDDRPLPKYLFPSRQTPGVLPYWELIKVAISKFQIKKFEEANTYFDQVLSNYPNTIHPEHFIKMAYVKKRLNIFAEAEKLFEREIDLVNSYKENQLALAQVKSKLNKFEEADEWFRKGFNKTLNHKLNEISPQIYMDAAESKRMLNQMEDANVLMSFAFKMYKKNHIDIPIDALLQAIWIKLGMNKKDEAAQLCYTVLNTIANADDIASFDLFAIASVFVHIGDKQNALTRLSHLLTIENLSPDLLLEAILLCKVLNDNEFLDDLFLKIPPSMIENFLSNHLITESFAKAEFIVDLTLKNYVPLYAHFSPDFIFNAALTKKEAKKELEADSILRSLSIEMVEDKAREFLSNFQLDSANFLYDFLLKTAPSFDVVPNKILCEAAIAKFYVDQAEANELFTLAIQKANEAKAPPLSETVLALASATKWHLNLTSEANDLFSLCLQNYKLENIPNHAIYHLIQSTLKTDKELSSKLLNHFLTRKDLSQKFLIEGIMMLIIEFHQEDEGLQLLGRLSDEFLIQNCRFLTSEKRIKITHYIMSRYHNLDVMPDAVLCDCALIKYHHGEQPLAENLFAQLLKKQSQPLSDDILEKIPLQMMLKVFDDLWAAYFSLPKNPPIIRLQAVRNSAVFYKSFLKKILNKDSFIPPFYLMAMAYVLYDLDCSYLEADYLVDLALKPENDLSVITPEQFEKIIIHQAYTGKEEKEKAINFGLKFHPRSDLLITYLAGCKWECRLLEEACYLYQIALNINPNSEHAARCLRHVKKIIKEKSKERSI